MRDWPLYRELWGVPNVRRLVTMQFLTNLVFYSTVIVAFESSRGLNYTGMFWLESMLSLAIFLFEVPTGVLADRWGYRRMLITGQGLMALGAVVFALSWGIWLFSLSCLIYGIGLACMSGCDSALLYESLPADRRERMGTAAFAMYSSGGSAGFFLGLAAGSFIGAVNPTLAVLISCLPVTVGWLIAFTLRPVAGKANEGEQPAAVTTLLRSALDLVRRDPQVVGLRLANSAAFAIGNAIFWYNQPLFEGAGIAVAWFGPLTAAAVGLRALVALAAPRAERLLGSRWALAIAWLLPGAAYMGFAAIKAPAGVTLLVWAVVAGAAWSGPVISNLMNSRISDGARATTLSILSFLGTLAGVGLNPAIGLAGDRGINMAVVCLGLGLVLLGGAALLLARKPRTAAVAAA